MPIYNPAPHIRLDDSGVAWIDDTNVKVVEVVLDHLAYGWSPEETHFQHPHLSLAQIHAALSYYYDNRAALDEEIERRARYVDQLAAPAAKLPLEPDSRHVESAEHYLHDVVRELVDRAKEAKSDRITDKDKASGYESGFDDGRAFGYYEVVSYLVHQARVFGLTRYAFPHWDFDADKELL